MYTRNFRKTLTYRILRRFAIFLAVLFTLELVPAGAWALGIHDAVTGTTAAIKAEKDKLALAQIQAKLKAQVANTPHLDPMHFSDNTPALSPYFTVNGASSILDEVGHLREPIPPSLLASWKSELAGLETPHIVKNANRAAQLHIFLGEYALAQNQAPEPAMSEFRAARLLVEPSSSLYSRANMDQALALYYDDSYAESHAAFLHALNSKAGPIGFDPKCGAAMMKHDMACEGYHAQHAKLGIPEPLTLDKFCVAASLANSLRALGMPWGRATVLKSIRVSGEGSNFQDVADACNKLGLAIHIVRVDNAGLRMLPKPLVAYVEDDHFVSITKADNTGVSYVCSDCGPWPGGIVHLTWKQWSAMNGSVVGVITQKGSSWDQQLSALPDSNHELAPSATPSRQYLASLGVKLASASLGTLTLANQAQRIELIKHVAVADVCWTNMGCGVQGLACVCPSWLAFFCGSDGGGLPPNCGCGGGPLLPSGMGLLSSNVGPSGGDPVGLAIGSEEYAPGGSTGSEVAPKKSQGSASQGSPSGGMAGTSQACDLYVYNPTGPAVAWSRNYSSLRGLEASWYQPYDFGDGWTTNYNVGVQDVSSGGAGTKYLYMENGQRIQLTAASVPTATTPDVSCTVQAGFPILADWMYNSSTSTTYFVITFQDRTKWVTTSLNSATNCYLLSQIRDCNYSSSSPTLNCISFNYTTGLNSAGVPLVPIAAGVGSSVSAIWPLLTSICDGSGSPLLVINRAPNGSGNITSIEDRYGRFVFYHEGMNLNGGSFPCNSQKLDWVSQVVQGVPTSIPPMRYQYGYSPVYSVNDDGSQSWATLTSISVPSPTGTGLSTSYINYTSGGFVSSLVDANGNTRTYTYGSGNTTSVTVTGTGSTVPYEYTVTFDSNMDELTRTDGGNSTVVETYTYGDSTNPYSPTEIEDGNGKIQTFTYDTHGIGNLIEADSRYSGTPGTTGTTYVADLATISYSNFALGEVTQTQEKAMLTGSPNTVVQAKSPTVYTYYEPSGNLDTVVAPTPGTVGSSSTVTYTYAYNSLGNMTSVTTPGNNSSSTITMSYGYGTTPQKDEALTATDALSHTTTYTYDYYGDIASVTDALGNETDYNYEDPNTNNGGATLGQLNKITYPPTTGTARATTVITYLYPGGPAAQVVDNDENGSPYRTEDIDYGSEGEVLEVSGSVPTEVVAYDDLYRAISLTDGNGNTSHAYFTHAGYLAGITYPGFSGTPSYSSSTGTWTGISGADSIFASGYDSIGDITSKVDGRGVTTDYTYSDLENLLTNIHYVLPSSPPTGLVGTPDVNVTYDSFGRTTTVDNGITKTTVGPSGYSSYDDDGNVLNIQTGYYNSAGTSILFNALVSYVYYADNQRQTMTTPSGTFTYDYDSGYRPTSLTNPSSETTNWSYYNNNWLSFQADYNSSSSLVSTASYSYDDRGFLTDLANTDSSSSTISEFGGSGSSVITYDAVGNLLSMPVNDAAYTTYSGTTSYGYDSKDELTSESSTRNGGYSNSFAYDAAQNPTTFRGSSVPTANSDNQIPQTGYSYDGNGNPTTYASNSLTFDPENRVVSYASAETNGYTPDGLRASTTTSSGSIYFLYDGLIPVSEMNSSGAVTATNTVGISGLISRDVSGSSVFYSYDPQGSASQRLSNTGSVLSNGMTDAFGTAIGSVSSDPYSGYNGASGYRNDAASGLQLLGHRFYDQSQGRFISRDPIGYDGGIDVYAYANNSPTNQRDETGYASRDTCLADAEAAFDEMEEAIDNLRVSDNKKAKLHKLNLEDYTNAVRSCNRRFPDIPPMPGRSRIGAPRPFPRRGLTPPPKAYSPMPGNQPGYRRPSTSCHGGNGQPSMLPGWP